MAWRIEEAVTRGEIDNTVEGRTTGRIWLAGRTEPLVLALEGDCWRDLAGTKLTFESKEAEPCDDALELDADQAGIIGDMTASRKGRVALVDEDEARGYYQNEEEVPFEWRNILYLEWFSATNGRVVIESGDFRLKISPQEWEMDQDAEEAQKLANLHAMRDFMAMVIDRIEPDEERKFAGELDEFAWEERLKESDRLSEAYQEVLEKYMEDPDSERKEAFVMGWDGLLDALADYDESESGEAGAEGGYFAGTNPFFDNDDEDEDDDEDGDEDDFGEDDDDEEDDNSRHPLQVKSRDLAKRAMELVGEDEGPGTPSFRLVTNLLQVSGKLAGVLHNGSGGWTPEAGFVLAVLKRCLFWLNDAVGACQDLAAAQKDAAARAAYLQLRAAMFGIRGEIVEMRRQMK